MKVVHSKTPTENVTFENVFWEPYEVTLVPSMQEEEECPFVDEIDTLQDAVIWLAEDVMDHEDVLHMLGEKIQSVEDNQLTDIENLSETIKILECMQESNKMMLDVIIEQDKRNDNVHVWFFIRQFILTALVIVIWFNVFF